MAVLGDIVECNCGAPQQLVAEDLRIQFHKRAGQDRFDCKWSGATADHWEPISRCLGCGATDKVRNTVAGAPQPYGCLGCGRTGTLLDFIDLRKLKNQPKPEAAKPTGKHRYQDKDKDRPRAPGNPPKCPACDSTRIRAAASGAKYALTCLDCGVTGDLGDFVITRVEAPRVTGDVPAVMTTRQPAAAPKKPPRTVRDVRADVEALGALSAAEVDQIVALAESFAKKAFSERSTGMAGFRKSAYHPMLDTFKERADALLASTDEALRDAADIAYWGALENIAAREGVHFRREDMAERGL